ncbi:hypothetical protein [Lentzea jiangxiensis]|uniref:Transposase n=1 Tax=Lentzea jiangxiensis TaxID=641025 RepID=A0A1H0LI64_9PSEU|nr:hypothetical protein [Lentzea jiangxiensis]SDO67711.1 hypothetical protein SAMN05421507_103324 [Lentzea jiangxiensis]
MDLTDPPLTDLPLTDLPLTDLPLTDDERAELARLRKENDFLRVQRDILLRVASDYAHDFEAVLRRDDP